MNNGKEVRFAEMFSGIGGFRLGLEKANEYCYEKETEQSKAATSDSKDIRYTARRSIYEKTLRCVWANDSNRYANQIYRKNFGSEELREEDIREIQAKAIPDFELLTAGFPCQAFSVAGKRKATKEARGTLFTHIVRVASAKKPKLLLLENVKGILSSELGRTFAIVLRALGNLGYLLEWQVLNSKCFGVPQNRERVFVVGHLGGKSGCQIFPIEENGNESVESCEETQRARSRICSTIYTKSHRGDATYVTEGEKESLIQVGELYEGSQLRVYNLEGHSPTLHKSRGNTEPLIMRWKRTEKAKQARSQLQKEEGRDYTPFGEEYRQLVPTEEKNFGCVTNALNRDTLLSQKSQIRRLTPTECERLQGFPDGWTEWGVNESGEKVRVSDTQRYKCLGNAVTVPVITFLGNKLIECLS